MLFATRDSILATILAYQFFDRTNDPVRLATSMYAELQQISLKLLGEGHPLTDYFSTVNIAAYIEISKVLFEATNFPFATEGEFLENAVCYDLSLHRLAGLVSILEQRILGKSSSSSTGFEQRLLSNGDRLEIPVEFLEIAHRNGWAEKFEIVNDGFRYLLLAPRSEYVGGESIITGMKSIQSLVPPKTLTALKRVGYYCLVPEGELQTMLAIRPAREGSGIWLGVPNPFHINNSTLSDLVHEGVHVDDLRNYPHNAPLNVTLLESRAELERHSFLVSTGDAAAADDCMRFNLNPYLELIQGRNVSSTPAYDRFEERLSNLLASAGDDIGQSIVRDLTQD